MKKKNKKPKYRSKFEALIGKQLGKRAEYESFSIGYTLLCRYIPDFKLHNGIIIEVKGKFDAADRRKHIVLQSTYPELDIRFVFYRSSERIRKNSKTTYADWCRKHGFTFAEGSVPEEWLNETGSKRLPKTGRK